MINISIHWFPIATLLLIALFAIVTDKISDDDAKRFLGFLLLVTGLINVIWYFIYGVYFVINNVNIVIS